MSTGFLRVASEWSNFPPPLTVGKGVLQNAAECAIIDFGQAATAWSSYRGKLMVGERRPGVHRVPERAAWMIMPEYRAGSCVGACPREVPGQREGMIEAVTMSEKASTFWEKLKSQDHGMDNQTMMRSAVSLIALVGFLLPWVTLDGHGSTMTGSEAIAYAFTNPERATIFSVSPQGALALWFSPVMTAAAVLYWFIRLTQGRHSLASHMLGTTLPIIMVLTTGAIASSDGFRLAGIPLLN